MQLDCGASTVTRNGLRSLATSTWTQRCSATEAKGAWKGCWRRSITPSGRRANKIWCPDTRWRGNPASAAHERFVRAVDCIGMKVCTVRMGISGATPNTRPRGRPPRHLRPSLQNVGHRSATSHSQLADGVADATNAAVLPLLTTPPTFRGRLMVTSVVPTAKGDTHTAPLETLSSIPWRPSRRSISPDFGRACAVKRWTRPQPTSHIKALIYLTTEINGRQTLASA